MNLPASLLSDVVVTLIFGAIAIALLVGAVKVWDVVTYRRASPAASRLND